MRYQTTFHEQSHTVAEIHDAASVSTPLTHRNGPTSLQGHGPPRTTGVPVARDGTWRTRPLGLIGRSLVALLSVADVVLLWYAARVPGAEALGPAVLASLFLPALLALWAITGRLKSAVAPAVVLFMLGLPFAFVAFVALSWKFGGLAGDSPEDELVTLVLLVFFLWAAWAVLAPAVLVVTALAVNGGRALWPPLRMQLARAAPFRLHLLLASTAVAAPWLIGIVGLRQPTGAPDAALVETYLEAQYNPTLGLYREAPNVASDTYWVYSDGYLAGADVSSWQVPPLRKWHVLRGEVVPADVFTYGSRVLELGGGVRTEVEDSGVVFADWLEYGDRVLLAAVNTQNAGDTARADELLAIARGMWDGRGLRDKVYRVDGKYETYKTALYYHATGDRRALGVLRTLQDADSTSNRSGGMYTEYGRDGRPFAQTDTNIETTAITLLALQQQHLASQ